MNCTLSVVMPVYNTEPLLLDRSVGSLLDQEYRDLELILVDDGSGELTARRLDQLAEQDARIRVIRQENQGASAARNTGIRAASGRFLTMMDADDAILPEAYGQVIRKMLKTGADAGVFGYRRVRASGASGTSGASGAFGPSGEALTVRNTEQAEFFPAVRGSRTALITPERLLPAVAAADHLRGGGFPWNKVWDVSRIGGAELFDQDLFSYEDKLWCVRMYLKCRKILLLPDLYYSYYQAENGLSKMESGGAAAAARKRGNAIRAYRRILETLPPLSPAYAAAAGFLLKTQIMGIVKGTWAS